MCPGYTQTDTQTHDVKTITPITSKTWVVIITESLCAYLVLFLQVSRVMATPFVDIGQYLVDLNDVFGRGGFGDVYKGEKKENKRIVAIKRIIMRGTSAEKEYENIKKLKDKKHPNVVNIDDIIREVGCIWIVMEHCAFGDLNNLFSGNYHLVEGMEERVKLMRQISLGLAFLHDHLVYHRDIKPANILVTTDENNGLVAKLSDFGLARIFEEDDSSSRMYSEVGTPHYKAPELFCPGRKLYYKNVDIFALGVTFLGMVQAKPNKKLQPKIENSRDLEESMGKIITYYSNEIPHSFPNSHKFY